MDKYEFRDVRFMSARDKELVLKAWVRFLRNGLRFEDFSRRLYEHLHLHCSFIAHYDRVGFYRTYFENGEETQRCFAPSSTSAENAVRSGTGAHGGSKETTGISHER